MRIKVRGQEVIVPSRRVPNYVAVAVRPMPVVTEEGTYVTFADLLKRSDNLATARRAANSYEGGPGTFTVVVDTTTGDEVAA